ncbi:sensor histidine kinase [Neorhizobium galegae]|uniref:C4-dicarboxylate transport sensor protein n=1 Tax=Neorhizobium galegae bv. orientalis str. HAMBI 540 TaxID=1028800 RepID=A0A068SZH8_NEOGA|nr:ATP-binding protein [Neorhizobium galegae]MCQ1854497.1 ATP-binding protein [Neorhizobium galegae]CDN51612.1 Signal transduction histidine kinase regulating C4-dicarboxylate transport system [Neorhizobium galegae bv. orientalis str. HAMBI 540]CDZ54731.1 Signal transduction histidine kinase regulating C4-dicarboxylate transport system [Neorhizobium galegae bv. orientalis]
MLEQRHREKSVKVPAFARTTWPVFGLTATAILISALYAAGHYGRSSAVAALIAQGHADANLKVALLRAVLERPRALPLLLAEDQQVVGALASRDAEAVDALDRKLEGLVAGTHASVLYVTGRDGIAVASSNWREPLSFVGNDYSFREYFQRAMENGTAEHFALGSVSKRPGLYISRRAENQAGALGVVVVKMEFDQLESDWRDANRPVYVTDANGVVLITSVPSWRFTTAAPLPAERLGAIRQSLQFGDAPLTPLPIVRQQPLSDDASIVSAVLPGTSEGEYLRLLTPVPSTSWRLEYLVPTEPSVAAAVREARLLALAVLVPILALIAFLLRRRQMITIRIAAEKTLREELERRVTERTVDLSRARDLLQEEIADHRSTESKLQVVQQELVQANRLAILGQVAAGVAHEINQPVATIRAYADNARIFLQRGRKASAEENLGEIAALTERIGMITEELKAFGRKGRTPPEAVDLRGAIEGAVVLLRSRFAGRLDILAIDLPPSGLAVTGNRVRLEQVLINLFQNALEALEGRIDASVNVSVETLSDEIVIRVSDNGPGIDPSIRSSLFSPFNTSKEKGLGLGLVISKDIVADYGGRIEVESGETGTTFIVYLRKAAS